MMACRSEVRTHLDLFSGIGGFALAARWAGLETIAFCENDPYCKKVLRKHWPDVPIHDDITKLDGTGFRDIFLITGGFPCQDISSAGTGAGIDGERSGLWTELHRIISEVRPRFALVENVPALTFRGGVRVIGDLAEIGYDAEWQIVGADDVGAPHRRKRIWIVAYSKKLHGNERREHPEQGQRQVSESGECGGSEDEECRGRWLPEPNVGRVAHGIPSRVDRLRGLGNAIVPQVAYEIINALKGKENETHHCRI